MKNCFEEIKGGLGFGAMRPPRDKNGAVIFGEFADMIDKYMSSGFNYFDTARAYVGGRSEESLKKCLTSRYPRESFVLCDKLSSEFFKSERDIYETFEKQLASCGVEYFDFYLMHALSSRSYKKYSELGAFEAAKKLKAQGKIRHIGISFHDTEDALDMILNEHPEIEVVQIQLNYLDMDNPGIRSRANYEMCAKHGKPAFVMEPIKGGRLVNLPDEAKSVLSKSGGGSPAAYALRYAAGFEGVRLVLSGMSDMAQVEENTALFGDLKPLSVRELEAVKKVCEILKNEQTVQCTGCEYCTRVCPKDIAIPLLISCLNSRIRYGEGGFYYEVYTTGRGRPEDCVKCGRCEAACPQNLEIRKILERTAKAFSDE